MATISIGKRHQLSHQAAGRGGDGLACDLEKRFALAWQWDGDDVRFERSGVSGSMHVGKTDIRLDVRLGMLLSPLKGSIEKEIHAQLDQLGATDTA